MMTVGALGDWVFMVTRKTSNSPNDVQRKAESSFYTAFEILKYIYQDIHIYNYEIINVYI